LAITENTHLLVGKQVQGGIVLEEDEEKNTYLVALITS
jgi:hypothetical protein